MGLTFEDFKGRIIRPDEMKSLFEINPNRKEYTVKLPDPWEHRYLVVEDVLVNPYDVKDFLIHSSYIAGTNDLIPDKTGAPGMQQPVANEWVKSFILYLRQLLYDLKITHRDITWYDFNCYNNVFWKNMIAIDSNYRPHVDPGDFAFNLFLSDDLHEDEGTAVFAINMPDGQKWIDIRDMERKSGIHPRMISQRMDQGRVGEGKLDNWRYFQGDDIYDYVTTVPAGFNCLSGYRGSLFHTAVYDPKNYSDDHVRYSFVAMLALTAPATGKSSFLTKNPNKS